MSISCPEMMLPIDNLSPVYIKTFCWQPILLPFSGCSQKFDFPGIKAPSADNWFSVKARPPFSVDGLQTLFVYVERLRVIRDFNTSRYMRYVTSGLRWLHRPVMQWVMKLYHSKVPPWFPNTVQYCWQPSISNCLKIINNFLSTPYYGAKRN